MSDPREELRSLIENAVMGEEQVMRWEDAAADAVLAAGYVKLSDLEWPWTAALIDRVADVLISREDPGKPRMAQASKWYQAAWRVIAKEHLGVVAAALAATPGDSNE